MPRCFIFGQWLRATNHTHPLHFVLTFVFLMLASSVLTLLLASPGMAQNTNSGEIRGTITDPSGAVVPDVTVTIRNVDTGISKDVTTNNDGIYDAVSILPGNYTLTFAARGFDKLVRNGITLQVGTLTVNAQLTVGNGSAGGPSYCRGHSAENGDRRAVHDARLQNHDGAARCRPELG
jgi:hypothetical protein